MGQATREPLSRSLDTLECCVSFTCWSWPSDGDVCPARHLDEPIRFGQQQRCGAPGRPFWSEHGRTTAPETFPTAQPRFTGATVRPRADASWARPDTAPFGSANAVEDRQAHGSLARHGAFAQFRQADPTPRDPLRVRCPIAGLAGLRSNSVTGAKPRARSCSRTKVRVGR